MYNSNNVKGQESSSIDLCLSQLGLEYVDLMLVHNPCTSAIEYGSATLPHFFEYFNHTGISAYAIKPMILHTGENMRELLQRVQHENCRVKVNKEVSYEKRKQTWLALVQAQKEGKCRHIGVSNYSPELLLEMKSYGTDIFPMVNEIEFHPKFASPEVLRVCNEMGIRVIGYGLGVSLSLEPSHSNQNQVIAEISRNRNITPLQVILKWALQKNVIPIPRSSSLLHLEENFNTSQLPFQFTDEEIKQIDDLNENYPFYWDHASSSLTCL